MKKFWMMGGAAVVVTVAAFVWASPVRSSENLLSKAQSEFAAKARDALMQRQMVQGPVMPAALPAPKSAPVQSEVIASPEPVAPTPVAAPEMPVEIKAPEAKTVTVASLETPTLSRETVSAPSIPPAPAPEPLPAPAAEVAPPAKIQLAAVPQEPQAEVSPKPAAAAAPVAEVTREEPPVNSRTSEEPRRQYKAERKPRNAQRERRTYDDDYRSDDRRDYRSDRRSDYRSDDRSDYRSEYRSERRSQRHYDLESLRSRAPEIAAAISRYW